MPCVGFGADTPVDEVEVCDIETLVKVVRDKELVGEAPPSVMLAEVVVNDS